MNEKQWYGSIGRKLLACDLMPPRFFLRGSIGVDVALPQVGDRDFADKRKERRRKRRSKPDRP